MERTLTQILFIKDQRYWLWLYIQKVKMSIFLDISDCNKTSSSVRICRFLKFCPVPKTLFLILKKKLKKVVKNKIQYVANHFLFSVSRYFHIIFESEAGMRDAGMPTSTKNYVLHLAYTYMTSFQESYLNLICQIAHICGHRWLEGFTFFESKQQFGVTVTPLAAVLSMVHTASLPHGRGWKSMGSPLG